jgi:hypothetical protein
LSSPDRDERSRSPRQGRKLNSTLNLKSPYSAVSKLSRLDVVVHKRFGVTLEVICDTSYEPLAFCAITVGFSSKKS